jgi:hypothetical protein
MLYPDPCEPSVILVSTRKQRISNPVIKDIGNYRWRFLLRTCCSTRRLDRLGKLLTLDRTLANKVPDGLQSEPSFSGA